jgi:hypothetical protein
MDRRRLTLAFACAAIAVLGVSSSALAATPGSSLSQAAGPFAARAAAPFVANEKSTTAYGPFGYTDAKFGPIECSGKHETNAKKGYAGNETEGGRDVFTCKSTTSEPILTTEGHGTAVSFAGWNSDYFYYVKGVVVEDSSITGKSHGRGQSFKATAYYPAPKAEEEPSGE